MVTLYDVPAEDLIAEVATELREHIEEPQWAAFTKSGSNREFPPDESDFWYTRAASVLRTVATEGPVGVERLTTIYGGSKAGSNRYGVSLTHRSDGSGKVIRTILQQLEEAGFIEKHPSDKGRVVTAEGQQLLDQTAGNVLTALDRPDLERYI